MSESNASDARCPVEIDLPPDHYRCEREAGHPGHHSCHDEGADRTAYWLRRGEPNHEPFSNLADTKALFAQLGYTVDLDTEG